MIRVYAFVPAGTAPPPAAGVGGVTLHAYTVGDVAAVAAREVRSAEGVREQAVAHGLVVEALREVADAVLPARFGELFDDEAALRVALAARADALRARLEQVRGCCEFGVRVVAEEEACGAVDGSDYLRSRLAARTKAAGVATALHGPLAGYARESVVFDDSRSAAYLVEQGRQATFRQAVARAAAHHPEATVVCTGPWAPYTFASGA